MAEPERAADGGRLRGADGVNPWRWSPNTLAFVALLLGWLGVYFAHQESSLWVGLALAVLATLVAWRSLGRRREVEREQTAVMREALHAAGRRNRELERLRHLASSMLAGSDLVSLQREVADAAAELLDAEMGSVSAVVEGGRFLRIVAGTGPAAASIGRLLPVEQSLAGWAVLDGAPLLVQDAQRDPRVSVGVVDATLRDGAIVPLRSAGVVIGTIAVFNKRSREPFTAYDLELLQTLGDQVVVGLDRAAMLEESRQTSEVLAAKNRELVRATELKSKFLANMSHELRTPLNAIIGFSELLQQDEVGPLSTTQRDFLDSVVRNAHHLLGLINSILDLSKIEAGRMALQLQHTDLRAAVHGAVTDTAPLRAAKHQHCTIEMSETDPLTVLADQQRVRQVLFNLLSNASKFTGEGGQVRVSALRTRAPLPIPAQRAGDAPGLATREVVWVAVSDTGVGITREDMPRLFQEFSQVDSTFGRQQQGTGLGLALSKRFVEMHGGTIGAESIPGAGSTFWFILPVEGPVRKVGE